MAAAARQTEQDEGRREANSKTFFFFSPDYRESCRSTNAGSENSRRKTLPDLGALIP
jgi:hypothetical protein